MSILDDIDTLRAVDKSNMLRFLESMPEMLLSAFKAAVDQGVEPPKIESYEAMTIAGVGGSAICGDLIANWLSQSLDKRVLVSRSYMLPRYIGRGDLVLVISYSGNTFETLRQMEEAISRGATIYAVTSGGKMDERCIKAGIPRLKVEQGIPPRAALPLIFGSLAYLICEGGSADSSKIERVAESLRTLRTKVGFKTSTEYNPSKKLAEKLLDTSVSIYALNRLESVARRFKCQLNENSKMEARFDLVPELCHNEVEAWESPRDIVSRTVILIRDTLESDVERRLLEALKRLLGELRITNLYEVYSEGSTLLEAIWTAIYVLDYVSYYLAVLRRVDPVTIQGINRFKSILGEMQLKS